MLGGRLGAATVRTALAGAAALVLPGAAAGSHPGEGAEVPGPSAHEAEVLGAAHAADHAEAHEAALREQRRLERMSSAEREATLAREQRQARAQAAQTAGKPSAVGAWTAGPFPIPNYAIHAVLLPTGKVLFWGYPPVDAGSGRRPNDGEAALWDPSAGTGSAAFERVPPPVIDPDGDGPLEAAPAPVYCSAQSLLPDGTVLLAGGNLVWPQNDRDDDYTDFAGWSGVLTFDPWTETWAEQPRMAAGRWYPSQVLLPDGRTLILGGYTDEAPGAVLTDDLEVFSPGAEGTRGTIELNEEDGRVTQLYPHLFGLPDGDVLLGGPGFQDSALLDTTSAGGGFDWTELPRQSHSRFGGTAVLRPGTPEGSWRVTQIGGYSGPPDADGTSAATATTETIDAREPTRGWQPDAALGVARSYHNTVLGPDGSLVTVGGGRGFTAADQNYAVDAQGTRRRVELYDPALGSWRLGPAQIEDRAYHSTALLLPDGRVWSAGDDLHGPGPVIGGYSATDTAEIYSPPYLFRGTRPRIGTAPSQLRWQDGFTISSAGKERIRNAVLVAPSATTHAADMHQRLVRLEVRTRHRAGGIDVVSPPSPAVAPPGYYMLFALSERNVPSVARWVRLTGAAAP
jgi:hypothetical protein